MCYSLQSLYVEWSSTSSVSVNDIECPTRRYIVRVRDSGRSSRARSWRVAASQSSTVISGLTPGSVQRVRLVVDTACRPHRGTVSRWTSVQLPAAAVSTPGRITKSVRDLQARDAALQRRSLLSASLFHLFGYWVSSQAVKAAHWLTLYCICNWLTHWCIAKN